MGDAIYMNKKFLKIIISDGVVTIATQTFNLFLIWFFAVKLHRQDMVALLGTLQVIEIVEVPQNFSRNFIFSVVRSSSK